MNEGDIQIIQEIIGHIRLAINGCKILQDRFKARMAGYTPDYPIQSVMEYGAWHGVTQAYGHMLLHIHTWLSELVKSYYEKKAQMEAHPAPPSPDEGHEVHNTPIPDYLKGINLDI